MLELNVVNRLDDNKVLISESDKVHANKPLRYYIANEDNADKFISERKGLDKCNDYQKLATNVLAAVTGLYIGSKINSNFVIKAGAAFVSGIGIGACLEKGENNLNKQAQMNSLKKFNVEEITSDEEKLVNAINYKSSENEEVVSE
ncbi:MAG: hypothetical protein NC200_04180 [Candidatus Gastranaerophilales bacterium]|nr:hypothetical protein [Candidatus Gastranaerophilales bacterium]